MTEEEGTIFDEPCQKFYQNLMCHSGTGVCCVEAKKPLPVFVANFRTNTVDLLPKKDYGNS